MENQKPIDWGSVAYYAIIAGIYCYALFPTQTRYFVYRCSKELRDTIKKIDALRKMKHDRLVMASEMHHVIAIMEEGGDAITRKLG